MTQPDDWFPRHHPYIINNRHKRQIYFRSQPSIMQRPYSSPPPNTRNRCRAADRPPSSTAFRSWVRHMRTATPDRIWCSTPNTTRQRCPIRPNRCTTTCHPTNRQRTRQSPPTWPHSRCRNRCRPADTRPVIRPLVLPLLVSHHILFRVSTRYESIRTFCEVYNVDYRSTQEL